jgi:hypothetical protein
MGYTIPYVRLQHWPKEILSSNCSLKYLGGLFSSVVVFFLDLSSGEKLLWSQVTKPPSLTPNWQHVCSFSESYSVTLKITIHFWKQSNSLKNTKCRQRHKTSHACIGKCKIVQLLEKKFAIIKIFLGACSLTRLNQMYTQRLLIKYS